MAQQTVGRLNVVVSANTTQLQTQLQGASRATQNFAVDVKKSSSAAAASLTEVAKGLARGGGITQAFQGLSAGAAGVVTALNPVAAIAATTALVLGGTFVQSLITARREADEFVAAAIKGFADLGEGAAAAAAAGQKRFKPAAAPPLVAAQQDLADAEQRRRNLQGIARRLAEEERFAIQERGKATPTENLPGFLQFFGRMFDQPVRDAQSKLHAAQQALSQAEQAEAALRQRIQQEQSEFFQKSLKGSGKFLGEFFGSAFEGKGKLKPLGELNFGEIFEGLAKNAGRGVSNLFRSDDTREDVISDILSGMRKVSEEERDLQSKTLEELKKLRADQSKTVTIGN